MRPAARFRRLPLFWKLLVPYVGLLVIVGTLGAFLITRDLSTRAQTTLNEQLLQSSLKARALLQERELYLLESANLAANLDGMAEAIRERDAAAVRRLLGTVLVLKDELNVVVVTTGDGRGLVGYTNGGAGARPRNERGTDWARHDFIASVLTDPSGDKASGLLDVPNGRALAIAAPVCSGPDRCDAVGAAIVALRMDHLAATALGRARPGRAGLRLFDADGTVLASSGTTPSGPARVSIDGERTVRRTEAIGGTEASTLYAPLEVQGRPIGLIGVSLPTAPAFASVRGAAVRLVAILIAALTGVVALGALLSRSIVGQTRSLLATNRALGQGDLSARAPIIADDEIGELARGLNQMAEQLQASYETLEVQVEQRTEEVQRLLRERTEFFASLSHELRTPIALIISHGEMLLDPDFRSSRRRIEERGSVIRDMGKQLLAAVNDILDLARIEAGSVRVALTDVAARSVIDDLRPTIHGLTSGAHLTASIDVPADLPMMRADPQRAREILINLIDNAVKYTPRGGRISLSARHAGGHVAISVTDTGIGIPPEAHDHIFEPFARVPRAEPQHGRSSTGLGLAIAKRLAEAQSGEITVQSEPGAGSTFTLLLPAVDPTLVRLDPAQRSEGTRARRARAGDRRGRARGRAS